MAVVFSSDKTQRYYRWTEWKAVYYVKGLPLQYECSEGIYTIWSYDGPEVLIAQIWKGQVPESSLTVYSQTQNDLDKVDFETNFKPTGNGTLSQIDTDGASIVRVKAAKKGWSYSAMPVELTTATIGASTFLKNSLGSNLPYVSARIYDEFNVEITTAGLLNVNLDLAVKTIIDFEPTFDYEIIGGSLRINSNPSQDVRLWIVGAPDIPAAYGGSKEFASGINLKFMTADSTLEVDGRVSKYMTYNAVNHQSKMRLIITHPPGVQVNMMFVFELYRQ